MGKFTTPCWKLLAERNFPPQLRLIREKETSITFCSPDRLIEGPGLPIRFYSGSI